MIPINYPSFDPSDAGLPHAYEGQRISFDIDPGQKGPSAVNVKVL